MLIPHWITASAPVYDFPPIHAALDEPDGLLAIGGDLRPERLVAAYMQGIFPWYSEHQPILWWSPNPRMVLFPEQIKISRSLRKNIRNSGFSITLDTDFKAVIHHCANRPGSVQNGTWITQDMVNAYCQLYELGFAHAIECRRDGELVGGLYGVAIGKVFFGESMFSRVSNVMIPRSEFQTLLNQFCHFERFPDPWPHHLDADLFGI